MSKPGRQPILGNSYSTRETSKSTAATQGQAQTPVPFFMEGKRGIMAEKRILPLGFIDRTTDDGAIIMLTKPSESHTIWLETPVTLHSRSAGEPLATARARGFITAVGYVTATCKIVETRMDAKWPRDEPVLRRGTPVYQALAGSFVPDPARTLSEEQAEDLGRLAAPVPRHHQAENAPEQRPPGTVQQRG